MATKLIRGQRVTWRLPKATEDIVGVVTEVKRGGWYTVQAQHENHAGQRRWLGYFYVVQARHVKLAETA